MKIQPKYDYRLDLVFSLRGKGRSNSGLSCPQRYGLTRAQAQEIIDAGEWPAFVSLWCTQRREFHRRNGIACHVCNCACSDYIIVLNKRLCKKCQRLIDRKMKDGRKRNNG